MQNSTQEIKTSYIPVLFLFVGAPPFRTNIPPKCRLVVMCTADRLDCTSEGRLAWWARGRLTLLCLFCVSFSCLAALTSLSARDRLVSLEYFCPIFVFANRSATRSAVRTVLSIPGLYWIATFYNLEMKTCANEDNQCIAVIDIVQISLTAIHRCCLMWGHRVAIDT